MGGAGIVAAGVVVAGVVAAGVVVVVVVMEVVGFVGLAAGETDLFKEEQKIVTFVYRE